MPKGPRFNNTTDQFTTRDSLGIEGPTATIQGELCPVVTTVTQRAFYWIFLTWNYYDFHVNYKGKKKEESDFDKGFLRKNDYFFVLSSLIAKRDTTRLNGVEKTSQDLEDNPVGPYARNEKYLLTRFGGMQYYNAGCVTLGFITDVSQDGKTTYEIPRITKELGLPMGQAFERVIQNTKYYKNYRLTSDPVPRGVLQEFGETVSLNLKGFDECKQLLRKALFETPKNSYLDNEKLILSKDYVKYYREHDGYLPSTLKELRKVLFDVYSPRGEARQIPPELASIAADWEIVVGRQYFTIAIELIWKYMLEQLKGKPPMDAAAWINGCLNSASWTMELTKPLNFYVPECNYPFAAREEMISKGARGSKDTLSNIENGIRVLLSLYNRFSNRSDLNEEYLAIGRDVSISMLISLVDEYTEKSVADFIAYIMTNWIIRKHERTAIEKLYYGRDGFFFERIDDKFCHKSSMYPDYQGIRLQQLTQVLKDLDMLGA